MLETAIIENCAPTLAGLKTGNIFTIQTSGIDIYMEIRRINQILVSRGLRFVPLRMQSETVMFYLYRPERLTKDLGNEDSMRILVSLGYPTGSAEGALVHLMHRLSGGSSFPHEIGLFLGYPAGDVLGFMKDSRKGVLCSGYWKVYSNETAARATWARYKMCTDIYRSQCQKGRSLETLAVIG